jgi:tetratricopeptide (TPR) repeat protein
MGHFSQSDLGRRFNSWKEIAAFFGRDERTARRWEKEHGLPVHRIPSASKGRVFAYETELQEWLSTSDAPNEAPAPLGQQPDPDTGPATEPAKGVPRGIAGRWFVPVAVCALLVATVLAYRTFHHSYVHAAVNSGTGMESRGAHPANSEAENLYLQGRYYWSKRTPADLNRAVDYFTQAIVRDPNYAKAYVGLADSYNLLREFSAMAPNEAYPRALAAASKAVKLDDNSAEAHTSLAFVTFFWSWDAEGAERQFKRALDLNPNAAGTHHWYASYLLTNRRLPEALAEIETARRLDPSSVAILADKAQILQVAGQTDAAETLLKQIENGEPTFASAHRYLSEVYFSRKDYPNYLSELEKTAELLNDQNEMEVAKAGEKGFAKGGYEGMLEGMLSVQQSLNDKGTLPGFYLAVTYARMGKKKQAMQCLETSFEQHDSLLLLLPTEPAFENMHNDPGFVDLLARVNPSVHLTPASAVQ